LENVCSQYSRGVAGGAVASTGSVWGAAAANSGTSILVEKMLNGELSDWDWSDVGRFAEETVIGGVAGKLLEGVVPRGPGRTPESLTTWLTGKIGGNTLWAQGAIENGVAFVGIRAGQAAYKKLFSKYPCQ